MIIDPNKLPFEARGLTKEQAEIGAAVLCLTSHGWMCVAPGGIDPFELQDASRELVEAVEKYIQPKKGEFLSRIDLLTVLRKVKKIINGSK